MRDTAVIVAAALLTGCVPRPVPVAVAPAPPPPVIVVAPPPAPTPINAGLSPAATLWHLRAGLNVAALACRGPEEATTVARYNALLAGHATALKAAEAAYAAEYQAGGGEWRDAYDDQMTRLYNHWGQARGRDEFCATAGAMPAELDTVAPVTDAGRRLAAIDRPFAPPFLHVDAGVFGSPPVRLASR